jgi:hypothetical protein
MGTYNTFEGDSLLNSIFDVIHLAIQDLAPEESSIGSNSDPSGVINDSETFSAHSGIPENPEPSWAEVDSLFEWILSVFDTKHWKYYRIPGQSILRFVYQGTYGKWVCLLAAPEDTKILVCSVFPTKALESQYPKIMPFIIQTNYQLDWGNFDLDLSDGEISFRNSLDLTHIPLRSELLIHLLENHLKQMDHHWLSLTKHLQTIDEGSNIYRESN